MVHSERSLRSFEANGEITERDYRIVYITDIGEAVSAGLTVMRPASPVVCEPDEVSAPVIGCVPSRNKGSAELPLVIDVAVVVAERAFTLVPAVRLRTCKPVAEVAENCRLVPSAALSWAATELAPPEKSTPIV